MDWWNWRMITCNRWYPDQRAYPLVIRSMRTGASGLAGTRPPWNNLKFSLRFSSSFQVLVSRLFQFFFLVLWISNGYLWWYLWVDSASCMIKRFVVVFIVTDIMCSHSPLQYVLNIYCYSEFHASYVTGNRAFLDLAGSWQAAAKSNVYNQRYRENRTMNTKRGAWR